MALVFGAIAPHGFSLIPEVSDDAEGGLQTRAALEELGRRCAASAVDVIVLAGPHGIRVEGAICLANVARGAGMLDWGGRRVEMNVPVDGALTDAIAAAAARHGVPIALAGFAGNRRDQSAIPLAWDAMVPLWFLGHGRNQVGQGHALAEPPEDETGPAVVLSAPSRALPRTAMVAFGRALAEAAEADARRVAFVASCDWAHTHRADGPYGFHPAAAEVDARVVDAVEANDLGRLLTLDEDLVRNGAIDGLWQALMLAGALEIVPMRGELLSYEHPRYYGMLVAAYAPEQSAKGDARV